MKKIPTVFLRDPDDRRYVIPEVNPGCEWVLAGEGVATRKYDGTCVMLDLNGRWWARREVKPGKKPPENYLPVETDETTGKTMGWEPIEQSSFAKVHAEALGPAETFRIQPGTFELVGPKINGNPEAVGRHMLVRHAAAEPFKGYPRDFDGLRETMQMLRSRGIEGLVWHHPDDRMAKLKVRDFPEEPLG